MTIRFVNAWNGYYSGQIIDGLSATEENRLIGLGFAVTDLDGPDRNGPGDKKESRYIKLSDYNVGIGGDDSVKIASAIADARLAGLDGVLADLDINLSAPIILGGPSVACFLVAYRDRPKVKITALPGYTGTMVSLLRGGIDGFTLIGSNKDVVGHRGIVIGDTLTPILGRQLKILKTAGVCTI